MRHLLPGYALTPVICTLLLCASCNSPTPKLTLKLETYREAINVEGWEVVEVEIRDSVFVEIKFDSSTIALFKSTLYFDKLKGPDGRISAICTHGESMELYRDSAFITYPEVWIQNDFSKKDSSGNALLDNKVEIHTFIADSDLEIRITKNENWKVGQTARYYVNHNLASARLNDGHHFIYTFNSGTIPFYEQNSEKNAVDLPYYSDVHYLTSDNEHLLSVIIHE